MRGCSGKGCATCGGVRHINGCATLTDATGPPKFGRDLVTAPLEEVVQVYGFCIRTLRLPVISVMIIGVMRFSYNDRAVLDGRFRHHLFQAVFMRTTYPSRYVYFRWSRVHTAVETAVTAPVGV